MTTDTAVPVDVLSAESLAARGQNDLTKTLEFMSPSFNYPRTSSGPSSAGARSFTLRGLIPDQTLVLVNGQRRHASSIITFNNGAFRGSVPVDLNMIPLTAIKRVEILRDGAAAQYGSDAIAGVINLVLRDEPGGAHGSVQYGQTQRGTGKTFIATARQGFALGDGGFVTLSTEVRDRGDTNAAEIDPRFGRVTSTLGDPQSTDIQAAANAELPLKGGATMFGYLTLGRRESEMSPLFRAPTVFPAFYPNGFLPIVNLDLKDLGANIGVRGTLAGWNWELTDTFGYSKGDYGVSNTVNTSLGTNSPKAFYGGGARYRQNLVNLTVRRALDVMAGANLAAGVEHRFEAYELVSGEPGSYTLSGAQGFPGFHPPSPVDVDRTGRSAFIDAELSPIQGLNLGAAARFEDYSDFGDATTGKLTAFWRPAPLIALRAAVSTGIRAPSLQQQYFSTVTSQLNNGVLQNVGNFAVTDPVSVALGASPLRPEKSKNYSAGIVLTPGHGLTFSLDAFRIDINDRIAMTENLQGPQVAAILATNGVTNAAVARFFTNASDTRTQGWEATLRWDARLAQDTRLALTMGYGAFDTDPLRIRTNPVLPSIPLLGPTSIDAVADAQPRLKALVNAELSWRAWRFTADVTDFGSTSIPFGTGSMRMQGKTSVDLSAAWSVTKALTVTAGVINAGDTYPNRVPGEATGRPYSEFDPMGFNGREYFLRLTAEF
uniref:TonB-dependent receptor plug domain-containing protein n=1 Tax=uncultured Caulobacter sp. TaxID=158749 RepID=UPI0025F892A6|nr:TonB-dependent receptor [uncultured Caulobacter sp.]